MPRSRVTGNGLALGVGRSPPDRPFLRETATPSGAGTSSGVVRYDQRQVARISSNRAIASSASSCDELSVNR
jgi:hypothetical protein